jgi:uncharacterized protein YdeI (YjbR/CyaY-like superfamily)
MNNTSVESYLEDGCGRCDKFKTPECKVHDWAEPLVALRDLLRETELVEEMKWGSPCYTLGGKNVVMIVARTDYCALSFFKGSALDDDEGLLERPGPNTKHGRLLKFRSAQDVSDLGQQARDFVRQAIEVQRSGKELPKTEREPVPAELQQKLDDDADFRQAFEALTPGRQRSHILYVGGAKQSKTRVRRVERCVPKVMAGKGYNER